jgi:hypothetical protein
MENGNKVRVIAFYLPQFHPTAENDEWWGKGFTEWTNVGKSRPLFKGHFQPRVPADLGYYDLRIPEVREAQAELAREAGIEGFCYWHYWFGEGKQLLEMPFQEVLESGKPDFPFSLCWANHSWYKKLWDPKAGEDKLLIEQKYPGEEDFINHFNHILPAVKDKRYIMVGNKPIFGIYGIRDLPNASEFIKIWNQLAIENGFGGFYFYSFEYKQKDIENSLSLGANAVVYDSMIDALINTFSGRLKFLLFSKIFFLPQMVSYKIYVNRLLKTMPISEKVLPCVLPNWDHTPRSGRKGKILTKSTPEKWGELLGGLLNKLKSKSGDDDNIIFVKSWNEWGEGNYLEPDLKYGKQYINVLKKALTKFN